MVNAHRLCFPATVACLESFGSGRLAGSYANGRSGSISAGATPARSDYPPKRERPDIPGVCLSVFQQLWDFSLSSAALFHLLDTVFTFSGTRHHRDALAKID
jgi:hypothetical protein